MTHTVELETPYGRVKATWQKAGRMIVVRYGERERKAQASEHDATNDFVARDILREWVAVDLKDDE